MWYTNSKVFLGGGESQEKCLVQKKRRQRVFIYLIFNNYTVGGSPLSNPYCRAKPKLSVVFENGQFRGHFFWTKTFQKNVKCYVEKILKMFLTFKKSFFSEHFFGKKNWKIF